MNTRLTHICGRKGLGGMKRQKTSKKIRHLKFIKQLNSITFAETFMQVTEIQDSKSTADIG